MILSAFAPEQLAGFGKFDPFGDGFMCFHNIFDQRLGFTSHDGRDIASLPGDRLFNK